MGFNYLFTFPPGYAWGSRARHRLVSESVSWCLETSLFFKKTPFPGRSSVPTSFVSLFIFYIFPYLLSKTMGYFSGCLMSFASIQKLFCGIYSAFKCSFDEFVGEKVVSLSYSSAILGPPPPVCFLTLLLLRLLVFFLLIVRHWLGSRHSSPSGSLLWIPLVWCLLALEFFQDPYLETLIPCTPFFFFFATSTTSWFPWWALS